MEPSAARVAKKWKKLPKGWTDKSVEKFWGTLTGGTPEHKVWDCIDKMTKPFGDGAGAFCGGLADWQMPGWRQKNKKESPEARSDAKSYWKGKMKKKGIAARVALRYAARIAPPSIVASADMLKRQGLTPVEVWYGEAKPSRKKVIGLGDMVQNRRGDLLYFAGVAPDGSAILGKTEQEAKRLHKKVIEDRKQWPPRVAGDTSAFIRLFHRSTLPEAIDGWLVALLDDAFGKWVRGTPSTTSSGAARKATLEGEVGGERGVTLQATVETVGMVGVKATVKVWNDQNTDHWDATFRGDKATFKEIVRNMTAPVGSMIKNLPQGRMAFSGSPLMLQPDYGHGNAAVPGDQEYHPCQHGGPCQCGGQCGCGKKAAVRKMMGAASPLFQKMLHRQYRLRAVDVSPPPGVARSKDEGDIQKWLDYYGRKHNLERWNDGRWASQKSASPKGIKDLKPNKWYISTEDGDTYGPYPNESKAKSDGKAAFRGSTEYVVAKGGTIGASVLNPRRFGLFTPDELVK